MIDKRFKITTKRIAVAMSNEEQALYKFAAARLSTLDISKRKKLQIINDAFDTFSKKDITIKKNDQLYFLGSAIRERNIAKHQHVLSYLRDHKNKALVYVLDDQVAIDLAAAIDGLIYFDPRTSDDVEYDMNNLLEEGVVVVNITRCGVGLDFHAKAILWYQMPLSASEDVQGSGRITRLSSDPSIEREITYLYFNNTLQDDWAAELAAAYAFNESAARIKKEKKSENDKLLEELGLFF